MTYESLIDSAKPFIAFALAGIITGLIYLGITGGGNFLNEEFEKYVKSIATEEEVEEFLDDTINRVEEDGYITEEINYSIKKFMVEGLKADEVEVEGTKDKVEEGEKVYLIITTRKNVTKISSVNTYMREGIAQ